MATPERTETGGPDASRETETGADSVLEDALEEVGAFSAKLARGTVLGAIAYLGEIGRLIGQSFVGLRHGVNLKDLFHQMTVIGVESIPLALLTVGFSGAVLTTYTLPSLRDFGAQHLVGGIVALSIVRETGPLITGITLVARAGSAITAEIGSMKATEQVDALRAMAISPVDYLVTPRLLACLFMVPAVTLFADAAGLLGGGILAASQGLAPRAFVESFRLLMDPRGSDVVEGIVKSILFGLIIAAIACREGLASAGGAEGVGRATIRSVVLAIVLIFAADLILTLLYKSNSFLP
jgi:phospholipid/cholesterol/gamma-HCH transport system permease protein